MWVIEGDPKYEEELPLKKNGFNVLWVDDIKPYRERKVRILNGVHTLTVPVGYLCGLETIKDAIGDPVVGKFMRQTIFREIVPTMPESISFANAVIERFENPFLHHKLLDIALNSISKFRTRCLPTLKDYMKKYNKTPSRIVFSLASLIVFYKGNYSVRDSKEVIDCFKTTNKNILSNTELWGEDLSELCEEVTEYIKCYK